MQFSDIIKRAREIKKAYDELNRREGNRAWGVSEYAQALVGDVGDLMKLIMAKRGFRFSAEENVSAALKHELADCLWGVLTIAGELGINLEKEFLVTMKELENKITERPVIKRRRKNVLKKIFPVLFIMILFGAGCGRVSAPSAPLSITQETSPPPTPASVSQVNQSKSTMLQKPGMLIDKSKTYTAVLKTSAGNITIALNASATPVTVNNFVYLARNNFYNGTPFHRVVKGFMIQGGDPKGDGTGSPGYEFDDEPFTGSYSRGTVAMANSGPNTNGSQFFIMHADYPLQPNYVIFGRVVSGMEVVDAIATAPVTRSFSGEPSKPINPIIVQSVEIVEK